MTIAIYIDYMILYDDGDDNNGDGEDNNGDGDDNNDDNDDENNDDCHLQVIIGGALASPPAPDPPSSFRLEIS